MQPDLSKYQKIREFGLSSISVNNKTTVVILSFIIAILGIVSYMSMPRATFPDLLIPNIYIGTAYPGNSAEDVEKLITRPLEKEIKAVSGVEHIKSTSLQGYSTIIAEFDFEVDPIEALRKIKDAVDRAKSNKAIPDDLPREPNVFEMNFSEFPVMNINLSGDFSMEQLKVYAEYLEDAIEAIPEVSKVNIRGVQEKEVKIDVDMHKMESMEISFEDIENSIRGENIIISGGDITGGGESRTVRVSGEFTDMDDIRNIIVKREKGNIVYLRDIAEVTFGFEQRKSYAREFMKPVVMVDVVKRAGANLIVASDKINAIIDKAKKSVLPANIELSITNDQSTMARNQVSNLENNIISGVILVVLVLLFFLGLRNALFVGIAMPLSMFMSYIFLSWLGVTLNIMVLFSLILALGMLVDNGIVVVENIYRMMAEGVPPAMASKKGVGEVAIPIISSTATTVAAFLPLAVWPGMMGEFMKYLPLTLMFVLSSSLFVALVINPVLTAMYMKVGEGAPNKRKSLLFSAGFTAFAAFLFMFKSYTAGNLFLCGALLTIIYVYLLHPGSVWFQAHGMPWVEKSYEGFIRFSLKGKNPVWFFTGMFLLLLFSFVMLGVFTPPVLFFPVNQPKYVNIFIEYPIGTDIETTNDLTKKIEENVAALLSKYNDTTVAGDEKTAKNFLVSSMISQVGEGTSDPSRGVVMGNTPHKARVQVSFVDFMYRRGVNTREVLEEIRGTLKNKYPGVTITADKDQSGPPRGKPVNIEVHGDDYDSLVVYAENIKAFVQSNNIPGVEELNMDIETGKPEIVVDIDRDKARRFNLSTGQIGTAIRTAIFGKEVSKYKEKEDEYPIQLRLAEKYRNNQDMVLNQRITFRDQSSGKIKQVPVSSVASAKKSSSVSEVKRKELNRVITVSSNVIEGYNPTQTVNEIKNLMNDYKLPEGYMVKFTGEQEEQAKEMSFLSKALLVAILLVFLIIVSQFNSFATPFIITTSVVFSLIGVLLGLVIFQMEFVVIMTMIGIISLAGVVVNNAIVLLDYTNLLFLRKAEHIMHSEGRARKLNYDEIKECIVQGGKTRLRPVLLTAITTVLGLIPLAVGMNLDFFTLFSEFDPQIYFGGDNVVFWGPMSWTVIFGLSFATFLTLVIVPVMFYLLQRMKYRLAR